MRLLDLFGKRPNDIDDEFKKALSAEIVKVGLEFQLSGQALLDVISKTEERMNEVVKEGGVPFVVVNGNDMLMPEGIELDPQLESIILELLQIRQDNSFGGYWHKQDSSSGKIVLFDVD